MKVVFFTYAYPPLKFPRSIQIARLVKYSRHSVRVVCCDDNVPKDFTITDHVDGKPAELLVFRRKDFKVFDPRYITSRLPLPDQYRTWALDTASRLVEQGGISPDDVLVTFGQPMSDHIAGLQLKRATGVPWIAHFSDPWSDNPFHKRPVITWLNRRMEESVIKSADRLVFTSEETVDLVMGKYPQECRLKASVLPHAFDSALYPPIQNTRSELVIRYLGNFYKSRNPNTLIIALAKLYKEYPEILRGVRVEMVGKIFGKIDYPDELNDLPAGFFNICSPVGYRDSLALMGESNLLLVIDAPSEQSVFLPSKLIDYIGAGRPILALSPPGAAATLVSRLGGRVVEPGDIADIAEKLSESIVNLRKGMPALWGDASVREEYAAPKVVARFDALIDELAMSGR